MQNAAYFRPSFSELKTDCARSPLIPLPSEGRIRAQTGRLQLNGPRVCQTPTAPHSHIVIRPRVPLGGLLAK